MVEIFRLKIYGRSKVFNADDNCGILFKHIPHCKLRSIYLSNQTFRDFVKQALFPNTNLAEFSWTKKKACRRSIKHDIDAKFIPPKWHYIQSGWDTFGVNYHHNHHHRQNHNHITHALVVSFIQIICGVKISGKIAALGRRILRRGLVSGLLCT